MRTQLAYIEMVRTLADAQVAASEIRRYGMIALRDQARNHRAVVERADVQVSDAISTPYDPVSYTHLTLPTIYSV